MKTKFYVLLALGFPFATFSQNTCATAVSVSAGTHTVVEVNGSGVPDPICAPGGMVNDPNPQGDSPAGEWYIYTPSDDYTVTVTTDLIANLNGDTRFHVYTGTCGALVCHAGDDDGGVLGSGYLSISTFNVQQGVDYYIAFDNRWKSDGFDFELIEDPFIAPPTAPISFTATPLPAITGTYRRGIVDMNGDYLDDIVVISTDQVQIHQQQVGGGFNTVNITTTNADYVPSWSMAVGDYDKNGFNDLVYGSSNGVTFMRANATGTGFTEISGPEYVFSQRSNFIDINNDGHLDAYVCHDVDPSVYYINDGTGNLVFNQGGLGDVPAGGHYASIWTDYNNDGKVDLFISKCSGGGQGATAKINELYRNEGNGVFTDVSVASNMADPVQTWSSAWNDFDNDGYMDALVGASNTNDGSHKLMYNNGDETFTDITAGSGWDANDHYDIEYVSYDFDNDGFADVLGAGSTIMFNNGGDLTFTPFEFDFTNGPIGDLNDDGFLDIQNGTTLYMNDGNSNNWIKISMQGIQSNSNGIGARVEIYGDWGKQIRDVQSGVGFRYMNTLNVHFGIGQATEIDSMIIRWPSGVVDGIANPTINETFHAVEGTHPLSLLAIDGESVHIYPNPAVNELTIENLAKIDARAVTIVSNLGATVMELNPTQANVDISKLETGMYILIIETKNGAKYSESFIKK